MLDPSPTSSPKGTVAICLAIQIPVLLPLLAVFVLKELLMLAGGMFLVLKKKKRPARPCGTASWARCCSTARLS